ncbi:SipW-dependent-type signal peptide-containing protein [Sanguibacter keddieii]|uniref:SipW-dependent-type signal peptide-containing protein n=1 Tax=Sanguibacter keddieii TaxID=60920 RepID=UPI0001B8476B|nr:SipW-dependent-type signal peptide-containing protein [Sanguibacter keddieii]
MAGRRSARVARGTRRSSKVKAVLAGGAVLGLGATVTLAAWTDTEWVFAGNAAGDGPGLGTSSFEVEQNTTNPYAEATYVQDETNPGGALAFGVSALSLTPGDAVYAPVALRTVEGSIAGSVTLQPAVAADGITTTDPGGALYGALTVRVAVSPTNTVCNAAAFTTGTIVATGPLATAAASTSQPLEGDGDSVQHYCFEITLPASPTLPGGTVLADLQGRTAAPAWNFAAVSQ